MRIEFHPSIDEICNGLTIVHDLESSSRRLAIKASYSHLVRMKEELIKVKMFVIVLLSIACKIESWVHYKPKFNLKDATKLR